MTNSFEINQKELVLTVITVESLLFLIAAIWGYFTPINPFQNIKPDFGDIMFAVLNICLLLAVNFMVINVFSKYIPFFRYLKEAYNEIAPIAANITFSGAFIIAVFSGFAEEFFFRGILQAQFGIIISSIIFGIFHIGNKKTVWYGIYAVLVGLYLGWLYHITENLLVTIIVHCVNNFLALFYMRYYYEKYIREINHD
ncbi:MAG: type II CAAX endopeptidase family protein [Candidatus Gastranaerophilales bacterium]|nr:type II CAAX endopeptidase family protein [Candidatus Gastranaerophilales bacterium]